MAIGENLELMDIGEVTVLGKIAAVLNKGRVEAFKLRREIAVHRQETIVVDFEIPAYVICATGVNGIAVIGDDAMMIRFIAVEIIVVKKYLAR